MRVRGESVDKIDNDSLSVDSSVAEFRGAETAPYQFLHRTMSHQPLSMVQQVQMEFEVWRQIVRSYDQRSRSDNTSAKKQQPQRQGSCKGDCPL